MIEEQGTVVAVDREFAWVNTIRESVCESCSAQKGCGQKVLSAITQGRSNQVKVARTLDVQVGDTVLLGIAEEALLKASLMAYLVPLLGLFLFAGIGELVLEFSDPGVALMGLSGLLGGLLLVKTLSSRLSCNPSYHPQLLRRLR